jgi:hypothetical protein
MGQRDHRLKRNRVALTEGEIDGCRRCVRLTISLDAGCYREWQLGCRWYTATTTVLMRGLYRVSEGRTSGNGGTISAPVSAEFAKKREWLRHAIGHEVTLVRSAGGSHYPALQRSQIGLSNMCQRETGQTVDSLVGPV